MIAGMFVFKDIWFSKIIFDKSNAKLIKEEILFYFFLLEDITIFHESFTKRRERSTKWGKWQLVGVLYLPPIRESILVFYLHITIFQLGSLLASWVKAKFWCCLQGWSCNWVDIDFVVHECKGKVLFVAAFCLIQVYDVSLVELRGEHRRARLNA